LPVDKLV